MRIPARSRAGTTLAAVIFALVASTIFAHQAAEPRPGESKTAILVCKMIEQNHIGHVKINEELSRKLFNRYVDLLDARKLYFTQADIDDLGHDRARLGESLKKGNVDFCYNTFDLFLQRVKERTKLADEFIEAKHDFATDEGMVIDAEKLPWAKNDEEIRERWRKQIKYDLLSLKLEDTPEAEAKRRLHTRYRVIVENYMQMEDSEKLELYLTALTHCLDPHSSYMSPQTSEEFRISMELRLEGIGAALQQEDGFTVVKKVVPGGAAEKDGHLKVGDKIVGVDSKDNGEFVDVIEMKLSKVVRMIRGPRGTKVRLKVRTAEHIDLKDPSKNRKSHEAIYTLTRQTIELTGQEVKGQIIQTGDRLKGTHSRVGIINIPSFYRDFQGASNGDDDFKSTAKDVQKVLTDFRNKGGVDLLVVDLRNNGGGALSEAIEVSGLFIESGPIVQVKEPGGERDTHQDTNPGIAYSQPLIVLTNRLSASASEIFAGVIKDYRRGIIIGDSSTHGKGTVQNVMKVGQTGPLASFFDKQDLGALKLTISQFYRVNGDSTQNKGVPSDVVLPGLLDHMDLGESSLDNALKFDHIDPADYQPWSWVNPEMVSLLQQRSQARVETDPEFIKLKKEIATFMERKNRKNISLNLEQRRKERVQDKLEEKKAEEVTADEQPDGPIFPVSYYNNEVLRVGLDYLQFVRGMVTAGK